MRFISLLTFSCLCGFVFSQPYLKENGKTRHRFAQTVFGLDMQGSCGGSGSFINENGNTEQFHLSPRINPRIYLAGTHFWGHAEFYLAIPLPGFGNHTYKSIRYTFSQADVFGIKLYPWPIQRHRLRPFAGFSISGISYRQYTNNDATSGPSITRVRVPLLAGLNYCTGRYLFEAGINYNPSNSLPYYLSPVQAARITTPPLLFWIGLRKWLETTVYSEPAYLSGETEKRYQALRQSRQLSSWFVGIGPSSAFFTRHSPFNAALFPFMDKPLSTIFPEISAGYFYEPFGMHAVAVFRHNGVQTAAYGVKQHYTRTALTLEVHKYLFDYNGFDPYIGACASYEWLGFSQTSLTDPKISAHQQRIAPGIVFGWDILPDKLQGMTLRTNLRYFPNLNLEPAHGKKIFLDQLEFNFIDLIIYPQRIKHINQAGQ